MTKSSAQPTFKANLREMPKGMLRNFASGVYQSFVANGGEVHQCRPAFAMGCELRPAVMQAIRREIRK